MIRALQRFASRKKLIINTEKTKIVTFSKGARSSGLRWNVNGEQFEEVAEFKYLGITLQRNGGYTRHFNDVTRRAIRRATEVWSLGERLFKNSFRTREQLFDTLVLPLMLYGAEVTGYHNSEQFVKIQRRYIKWVLGLPKGTRNGLIDLEVGKNSPTVMCLQKALKYENILMHRNSPLLRVAQRKMLEWKDEVDARGKALNHLGWAVDEAGRRFQTVDGFWTTLSNAIIQQERQLSQVAADKTEWYVQPRGDRAEYFQTGDMDIRLIARFRCGAEANATDRWREDAKCRMCKRQRETQSHVALCQGFRKDWRELFCETGKNIEEFRTIVELREKSV